MDSASDYLNNQTNFFGSRNEDDPDRPRWCTGTRQVAEYDYHRADGSHAFGIRKGIRPDGDKAFLTFRINRLSFSDRACADDPKDRDPLLWGQGDEPSVLYHLPQLLASTMDRLVLVTEGEKDAETAEALGFVATCNPFGACKWRDAYSRILAGRDLVLVPDNDDAGRLHLKWVALSVVPLAKRVRVLQLPGLKVGGDLTDWANAAPDAKTKIIKLIEQGPSGPHCGGVR